MRYVQNDKYLLSNAAVRSIVLGYYINTIHLNSVNPDGAVPDALPDKSYQLIQ